MLHNINKICIHILNKLYCILYTLKPMYIKLQNLNANKMLFQCTRMTCGDILEFIFHVFLSIYKIYTNTYNKYMYMRKSFSFFTSFTCI